MFAALLVGLDGSVYADVALEQAVVLARRFGSSVVVVYAHEPGRAVDGGLLDRARFRLTGGGVPVRVVERGGEADRVLTELAGEVEAVLVGRRGDERRGSLGGTAAALLRTASRCVIACGGAPSPMRHCAVAFDGGETSRRALELAARFTAVSQGVLHVLHANDDPIAARAVIGLAEAALSLQAVTYHTHVRAGTPAAAVADLVRETRADALFAGAHVHREERGRPSPVVISHAEDILKRTAIPVVVQP
jgi:nucleotide-binding universal stress UspA family protein